MNVALVGPVDVHPWLGSPLDWTQPVMSVEYGVVVQAMYGLAAATRERFPVCVPSTWTIQLAWQLAMGTNHWVCCVPQGVAHALVCVVSMNTYIIMERPWRDAIYYVWNATRLFPFLSKHDGTLLDGYLLGEHLYLRDAISVDGSLVRSAPLSGRLDALRGAIAGEKLASPCRYLPMKEIGTLLAENEYAHTLQFVCESFSYRLGANAQVLEWSPRQLFIFRVQRQHLPAGGAAAASAPAADAPTQNAANGGESKNGAALSNKKKKKKKKKMEEKKAFFQLQKFDSETGDYRVHDWISSIDSRYDHLDGRVCSFWWNEEGFTFAPEGTSGVVKRHKGGWEFHGLSEQYKPDDVATVRRLVAKVQAKKTVTPLSAVIHSMEQLTL